MGAGWARRPAGSSGGTTLGTKKKSTRASADPGKKLAIEIARLAEADNCQNVVLLDLRGRSPVTDYFVIATGTSDRQRASVAEDVEELAGEHGRSVYGVSGLEQPAWILIDLVDIVVHLFDAGTRAFYDLDMLWGDAPRVRWRKRATPRRDDTTTP